MLKKSTVVSSSKTRESAWLGHLELLAGLPYPAAVLIPAVVAAVRSGFDADFGDFGSTEGQDLKPVGFWFERISESGLHWFMANFDLAFAQMSLREQLESDGESYRRMFSSPGIEESPAFKAICEPDGIRWLTGVPLLTRDGGCLGFLHLMRRASAGPFTDREQARLRRARDSLRGLGEVKKSPQPCTLHPAGSAMLRVNAAGRITARNARAHELLFHSHDSRIGALDWAARNLSALPESVREMVRGLLISNDGSDSIHYDLTLACGTMAFRAERLHALAGDGPEVIVTMTHMEPADLIVARQLLNWSLSPKQKQLLVASVRQPSHQDLAQQLGCTVGTLKAYINSLQAKLGVSSRQAFIDRLLEDARQEREL
jgi:DNA-binding CsgD family transcriptional regulator